MVGRLRLLTKHFCDKLLGECVHNPDTMEYWTHHIWKINDASIPISEILMENNVEDDSPLSHSLGYLLQRNRAALWHLYTKTASENSGQEREHVEPVNAIYSALREMTKGRHMLQLWQKLMIADGWKPQRPAPNPPESAFFSDDRELQEMIKVTEQLRKSQDFSDDERAHKSIDTLLQYLRILALQPSFCSPGLQKELVWIHRCLYQMTLGPSHTALCKNLDILKKMDSNHFAHLAATIPGTPEYESSF